MNATQILRQLPVNNREKILAEEQDLRDIMKFINYYHNAHKSDYDAISEEFWLDNAHDTALCIYNFLKKYVPYKPETEADQTIRRPGRLISDALSGVAMYNDCKHFSSFINGIVDSLNRKGYPISCKYRFVSDEPDADIHHVFAIVNDNAGTYWVDPVLNSFDERPQFFNMKDVAPGIAGVGRLTYLSGSDVGKPRSISKEWGADTVRDFAKNRGLRLTHGYETEARVRGELGKSNFFNRLQKGIRHDVNAFKNAVNQDVNKLKYLALSVADEPARQAFLALLDINAFNLSTRVIEAINRKSGIEHAWQKLGGNPAKLIQAAKNGQHFKHHGLKGTYNSMHLPRRRSGVQVGARIGVISEAALITLASAIVAALGAYLKSTEQEKQSMANKASAGAQQIITNAQGSMAPGAKSHSGWLPGQAITTNSSMDTATAPTAGTPSMSIQAGVDSNGQPAITVAAVNHPALDNAGTPPPEEPDINKSVPSATPDHNGVPAKISNFIKTYKKPLLITGGVIILLSMSGPIFKKLKKTLK